MRFTEALRLGSMVTKQAFHGGTFFDERCALKTACFALGIKNIGTFHAIAMWPWMMQLHVSCPADDQCTPFGKAKDDVGWIIVHLNDTHRWTREQIAEWVASIEPQDEQIEFSGQGPVAASLEVPAL